MTDISLQYDIIYQDTYDVQNDYSYKQKYRDNKNNVKPRNSRVNCGPANGACNNMTYVAFSQWNLTH